MSLSDGAFTYICQFIRERSAIVLDDTKHYLVESRLAPLVRTEGLGTLEALVDRLRREAFGPLHRQVVEAITTNETSFFRDRYPFDLLARRVVPKLIELRARERCLRIWCAACASGQELYTIAMLLHEQFPVLRGWSVEIFGTDLSTHMLARSSEGRYSQLEVNRGLPARLLVKYFEKAGTDWQVKKVLRDMIRVAQQNLAGEWPPMGAWDIVFLRNVLIYFSIDTKKEILGRVHQLLKTDGYLFLGLAETTLSLDERFRRVPEMKAGCYQVRAASGSAHAIC